MVINETPAPICSQTTAAAALAGAVGLTRWECRCAATPVLLGVVDQAGTLHLKVRDRYYHIARGHVRTTCHRCGCEHTLMVPEVSHVSA